MAANLNLLAAVADEDDEFLLVSNFTNREYSSYECRLKIEDLTNTQCRQFFRFEKNDLDRLRRSLNIPDKIVCRNGTVTNGLEGLCIVLRRLAYPNRLEDISSLFGRPADQLSYIINQVIDIIYDNYAEKLTNLDPTWLTQERLTAFSNAISAQGSPLQNCWGFIDGTIRPICRPNRNQNTVFSGHKRVHGIKFQSIVTPDGMIANLYGPVEARRHDSGMLRLSGILTDLEENMTFPDGTTYSLYGDPAYPMQPHLIAPFRGGVLSQEEEEFNKLMSSVRVSVEWVFGKILSLFAFLDFKKNLKLYLQPVAKYYFIAGLLTNCHTCLYGSETSTFFDVEPPSLEDYLRI